jgi:hypothetical protein
MTNTERLLLDTLPHWSGVTFITASEKLGDMWIRGERAGHHGALLYDRAGIDRLRTELLQDFTGAPPVAAFQAGGAIQTVADLDNQVQRFGQRAMSASANLLASVPGRARRGLTAHLRRVEMLRGSQPERGGSVLAATAKKAGRGTR